MFHVQPFTQARMEADRRLAAECARERGVSGRIGRTGRLVAQIPVGAFFNALNKEHEHADGKGCWDDPGFREHALRVNPELAVRYEGAAHAVARPSSVFGVGRLTRFGRATFHRRYGKEGNGAAGEAGAKGAA